VGVGVEFELLEQEEEFWYSVVEEDWCDGIEEYGD